MISNALFSDGFCKMSSRCHIGVRFNSPSMIYIRNELDTQFSIGAAMQKLQYRETHMLWEFVLVTNCATKLQYRISQKLLNNIWLNNTHWYAQSLAVIYVRALSIHHSVSNDISLRWLVDICIYAYMCWFCLRVCLCAHVHSWAMCAHRQTYWQNYSSALYISQSCLHCLPV